jgi:hypothetical protein
MKEVPFGWPWRSFRLTVAIIGLGYVANIAIIKDAVYGRRKSKRTMRVNFLQ